MINRRSAVRENLFTIRELVLFMWRGRTWWLTPVVVVLILVSLLVLFAQSSAVAPFIYTMF